MPEDPTSEFAGTAAAQVGTSRRAAPPWERGFFGHPRGLSTLFFTEMWERFSFYGMRAILILFMTATVANGGLGFNTQTAGAIYGLYLAFVYMGALPGGWLADRFLGQRRAVFLGGIVIACGHFSMALPVLREFGVPIPQLPPFYLGLLLIVIGTSLLKPNVSTMVGELYREQESARRDAGFSIFYMGINTGAFLAPLVCGYLGQRINWHLGFAAAGVGMVLGLMQYLAGGKYLGEAGLHPDRRAGEDGVRQKRRLFAGVGVAAILLAALVALQLTGALDVSIVQVANATGIIILGVTSLYFLYLFSAGHLDAVEKKRVVVVGILFLSAAIFWAGFEQAGSSLNLVAEQLTNRVVFGWDVPASWLQSVNPLLIIALAPVFAWVWIALSEKKREPSSPSKFAVGLILLGAGFAVLIVGTMRAAQGHLISPAWLVITYLLHTMGELALSPVGLSTVTKLAPHRMVGQMMGIWFMASALGNLIAGQLAGLTGAGEGAGGEVSPEKATQIFTVVAAVTIGYGLLLALVARPIRKKLMGGVR